MICSTADANGFSLYSIRCDVNECVFDILQFVALINFANYHSHFLRQKCEWYKKHFKKWL